MTLKLAQNHPSFGLNGSHKARNSLSAKEPRFCPPPDTFKASQRKEFGPILAAHDCQNGRKLLLEKDLWKRTFPKKHNVRTELQSITTADSMPDVEPVECAIRLALPDLLRP